jgi:hypothetical protein
MGLGLCGGKAGDNVGEPTGLGEWRDLGGDVNDAHGD